MRIRTIKPEFWTDATMVQMDPLARLLFIGLWNVADDHGYLPDEPDRLAMLVLPKEPTERVEEMVDLLIAADRLERIEDELGSVLRVKNWERHQRVDKPSTSKLARDGKKQKIPDAVRRAVAVKYGCKPGGETKAKCYHCGAEGSIKWWKNRTGGPSFWVSFSGLTLDHLEAEANGGETAEPNIVLACRPCNSGKKDNPAFALALAKLREDSVRTRESSPLEGKGKEGKGSGKGTEEGGPVLSEAVLEEQVFEHWKVAMAKGPGTLFTRDRREKVRARLAEGYSIDDLKAAVDGCTKTPHNMGVNDTGERWDDLELICRSGRHVERFRANATSPPKPAEATRLSDVSTAPRPEGRVRL